MTKAQEKSERIAEAKWQAFAGKVARLTGHLIYDRTPMAAVRAAYDAGKTADAFAAEIAAQEPVGKVIHPMKADAVRRAREAAIERVAKARADLEAHGWDRNAAAPYPNHKLLSGARYEAARTKYEVYSRLTRSLEGSHRPGEAVPVRMSDSGIERFIADHERDAAFQYDAFIVKLVAKVGPVESATLSGDHIWGHSILTVTKRDGVEVYGERWKTQQIVNVSKLGLLFNQWPTRKLKGGA